MGTVLDAERSDLGGNIRHGDINTFAPRLWRFLVERYGVSSVLDVGCGEGHAVKFFLGLGLVAHGIEGLRKNVERAVTPIALHDILSGPYFMPVDMVWSCEVAEHIDPSRVDHFLDTLANGRIVAMTHAVPGQIGYHHVNCQPQEYWVEHMTKRGYVLDPNTTVFRNIDRTSEHPTYFASSGLVFLRK